MKKTKLRIDYKDGVIFSLVMLFLTIVLFSFYPGIPTVDGNNQWQQIENNYIVNNHPFFSTFVWWLLAHIWHSQTILMIFQILLISLIWTYICHELRDQNNFVKQIIYTVILCFIPIFFAYSVIAWKDIIYSYMLVLLAVMFYVGIKKEFNYSYTNLFIINLCMVVACLYRYNGIIAVALCLITFLVLFIKYKVGTKKILIGFTMFVTMFSILKIPEMVMCHKSEDTPSNDIILFILSSFVVENKIDDPKDLELINSFYPIDKLKENYNPYCINYIVAVEEYNREIYSKHMNEVYGILLKYALKNPLTIVHHYLQSDNLLIGVNLEGKGYVYTYPFEEWYSEGGGNFSDKITPIFNLGNQLYLKLINTSLSLKMLYMPGIILYTSIVLMLFIVRRTKDKRYFLVLLPMIYNTCSLLPINVAQDLRYAYINFLTLLLIVIPLMLFLKNNEKAKEKEQKYENKELKTLVIIPAYNEEEAIEKVVNSVYEQKIENCDVIVINDGSKDNTYNVAKKTKAIVIDAPNNLGIGGAVQTGYLYAKKNNYDIAIQIDGDGQHNPIYIRNLIEEIKDGNDMVIGSRFIGKTNYNQTFFRMFGINIISAIIKIMTGVKIYDTTSGYRAINRNIIEEFVNSYPYDYPEPCTNMHMIKKGYKVKEVAVEMRQRETGVSSISPLKSVSYMFKVVLYIFLMGLKD